MSPDVDQGLYDAHLYIRLYKQVQAVKASEGIPFKTSDTT